MKISAIKTFLMQVGTPGLGRSHSASFSGSRNWLFVRVETDEGVYGVGEGSGWPRVVETAVKDYAPLLVGEDPCDIDRLWHKLFLASMGHGQLGTVGGGALTAIEMALWDIKGKALGAPVWQLLGGRFRDRIPVYTHAKTADEARRLKGLGYGALKVSFTGFADPAVVAAIREAVGPEIDLMVDCHGPSWMTFADAVRTARALEPLEILFFEDPLPPEQWEQYERLRQMTTIPLAAGERLATIWGFRPLIERELVAVVQPDTGRAGGISQMRKIAAIAEAHDIMVAPHSGSLGPIAEVAALHVLATIPNALVLETFAEDWRGRYEVVTPIFRAEGGLMSVPNTPGLGIDLVEAEILKYPSERNVREAPGKGTGAFEPGTELAYPYTQLRLRRALRFGRDGAKPIV